ncbi:MAG: aspartate 1-decarboxylase [Bacteroidia bacterium]
MWIEVMRAKIHRVRLVQVELDYVGSITLDKRLLEASGILPNEKVHVLNVNNGARMETYVIEGEADSGIVALNGPAARLGLPGDILIVVAYAWMPLEEARTYKPVVIFPDENNRIRP